VPSHATGRSSHNFFGVKAGSRWDGATVSVSTLEYENGMPVAKHEQLRAYDSPQESFRDYVELLRNNPRYADAIGTGKDAHAFAAALQRGGYATDPAYARKITAIAQNLPLNATSLKSADLRPIATGRGPI
jgi:flagellar protein FlgJ